MGFFLINHPFGGTPMAMETPIWIRVIYHLVSGGNDDGGAIWLFIFPTKNGGSQLELGIWVSQPCDSSSKSWKSPSLPFCLYSYSKLASWFIAHLLHDIAWHSHLGNSKARILDGPTLVHPWNDHRIFKLCRDSSCAAFFLWLKQRPCCLSLNDT